MLRVRIHGNAGYTLPICIRRYVVKCGGDECVIYLEDAIIHWQLVICAISYRRKESVSCGAML